MFWFVFAWGAAATVAAASDRCRRGSCPGCPTSGPGCRSTVTLDPATSRKARVQQRLDPAAHLRRGRSSLGLAAVGYVQAARLLMGPFMVIFLGMCAGDRCRRPRGSCVVPHGTCRCSACWLSAGLALLGAGLGSRAAGGAAERTRRAAAWQQLWRPTYPLVLPSTIAVMGGCVQAGAIDGPARPRRRAAEPARHGARRRPLFLGLRPGGSLPRRGATGTVLGAAIASWIGALLFWWQLRVELKKFNSAPAAAEAAQGVPATADGSPGPPATADGSRSLSAAADGRRPDP